MLSQYPQSAFQGFSGVAGVSSSLRPKPSASICSVQRIPRISRKWAFLKRDLFQKAPFFLTPIRQEHPFPENGRGFGVFGFRGGFFRAVFLAPEKKAKF